MLIICTSILIGSVISLYNQTDELTKILDPRVNNIAEINSGVSVDVSLSKDKRYAAYSLDDADVKAGDLHLINKDTQLEIDSVDGMMFSDRQGSDGEVLPAIKWWTLNAETETSLVNEGNATVWLIDYASAENQMMENSGLMFSMAGCMISVCLIPFALILFMMGRKKKNTQGVMLANNAVGGLNQNLMSSNNIGDNANILSTNHVFGLTHGDENLKNDIINSIPKNDGVTITETAEKVPPPFADANNSEFVENVVQENIRIKKEIASVTNEELPKSENVSWKDWDDG